LAIAMFALAATFYFYEFLLQVSPSIMARNLLHDFGIDGTVLGLLSGAYYYSYTLMQVPGGFLYDHFGARRVITAAILICALGALLFGLAPSPTMLGISRFLMGIGSACSYLGVLSICVRWIPKKYFALFAGLSQTIGSIGAATGQAPLAAVINHIGWRESMIGLSIIGAIIGLVIFLFLRDAPKKIRHHKRKRLQSIQIKKVLLTILREKQTWVIAAFSLCIWSPIPIFASLWGVPFLMRKFAVNNVVAGSICSMAWFGTALGGPLSGWLSIHIKKRHAILIFAALAGLIASCILIYVPMPFWVGYILLFVFGCACGSQALTFGFVRHNNSPQIASTAMGFNNMAIVIGGAFFQPLVGYILDLYWKGGFHKGAEHGARAYSIHAYHIALLLIPACFILAILVGLFVKNK
ncbi:MAG: MFS transporter, partial [Gammaproteobacteria bacterium]|nr:MFS transporter [Gammaproteobacteria bacterium]